MVHFVVALLPEARPLIKHFGLRAENPVGAFPIYQREGMRLVISGIGKTAAAAATGYLHGIAKVAAPVVWINVGLGGHRDLEIGQVVLAFKVTDFATEESWYPPRLLDSPCRTGKVLTVDKVETVYDSECVYEMEASGFCAAACRPSAPELVQCVKVISDNRLTPFQGIRPSKVEAWMRGQLAVIEAVVNGTAKLAEQSAKIEGEPPEMAAFTGRWKFSLFEQRRLLRLLRYWHALSLDSKALTEEMRALPKGKDVLRRLEERLDVMAMGR